ncbi:MAG TPA: hypothetical protein VKT49_19065 [Bryobacteraceae bacterium]|nr:hypothetical protein [Bryobacteraceae bacterium]
MTNQDESQPLQKESAEPGCKKPYQSPELTVHGRVDQLTRFLAISNPH